MRQINRSVICYLPLQFNDFFSWFWHLLLVFIAFCWRYKGMNCLAHHLSKNNNEREKHKWL